MNDHEIIGLYWSRSESAIAATAEKYGNYCHAIAYNILHSSDDAEECANDTYLSAWNTIPPQRPNRLSIYLGKITRNLALNRYKRCTAQKRGHGQVALALSELEACVPAEGMWSERSRKPNWLPPLTVSCTQSHGETVISLFADTGICTRYGISRTHTE